MVELTDLPIEVQEQIHSHLSKHDLTQCARVSQAWFSLFNPPLWRSISVFTQQKDRYGVMMRMPSPDGQGPRQGGNGGAIDFSRFKAWIQSVDGRGQEGIRRNGHLMRELRTEFCSILDLIVEADRDEEGRGRRCVTGLTELMYFSDPMFGGKDWKLDQGRPEFRTSFEICPWFFDQDGEGEGTTGLSRAPLSPPPVKSALVQLLQQNQNLKTLTLFGTVTLHQYEKSDANGCIVDPSIVNSWLEALPESLETLSMDTPWSNPENQRVGERERPTFSVPVLRKVHTLNLVSARCPYFRQYDEPTNFYAELIRACPNLETLRLPVYSSPATRDSTTGFTWDWEAQDYARIFQESCPKLTALCIDGQTSDDHFAQLLESGSRLGWKSIKIGDRFYPGPARESSVNIDFGPLSTEALLKHAGTLLNVRLHNCSKVPSAAIQQLLCTAFQLRSFHSVSTGSTLQEATLDARDMVGSEWVCDGLESFVCRITHIPRPDLGLKWAVESYSWDRYNRYHGPSFEASYLESLSSGGTYTSEESWSLQRRVYNQLARLVRLRELILETKRYTIPYQDDLIPGPTVVQSDNWMDFENWIEIQNCFQPDGLSMTLASGMDVLKELKALKLIGLPYGLDREEEQAWRKEHWPKAIDVCANKRLEDSCWSSMFDPPKEWGTL